MSKFYTPTPLYNPQILPQKDTTEQILDFQKQQKATQRADEKYAMDMKKAQQAYEAGMLNLNAAKIKMDDVKRKMALDNEAAQTYNSITASGGSRADAFRAVDNLFLQKGGWELYNQNREDLANEQAKLLKRAPQDPSAAQLYLDIHNAHATNDNQMTMDSLMQSLAKKEPRLLSNGKTARFNPKTQLYEIVDTRDEATKKYEQEKRNLELQKNKAQINAYNQRAAAYSQPQQKPVKISWKFTPNGRGMVASNPQTGEPVYRKIPKEFANIDDKQNVIIQKNDAGTGYDVIDKNTQQYVKTIPIPKSSQKAQSSSGEVVSGQVKDAKKFLDKIFSQIDSIKNKSNAFGFLGANGGDESKKRIAELKDDYNRIIPFLEKNAPMEAEVYKAKMNEAEKAIDKKIKKEESAAQSLLQKFRGDATTVALPQDNATVGGYQDWGSIK